MGKTDMKHVIENHGPLLLSSNYFGGELEEGGKYFVSCNAGCVRILWPRCRRREVNDMRTSAYVILTRGLYEGAEGLEILFEDKSPSPYCLHLTDASADLLPGDPGEVQQWTVAVWMWREDKPAKVLERRAHWRRVATLPHLQPLDK